MQGTRVMLAVAVLIAGAAIGALACSDGEAPDSSAATATETEATPASTQSLETPAAGVVAVALVEYQVRPDVATAPAGQVTFNARDLGGNNHELLVIKSDLSPESLPTNPHGSFDEASADVEIVDEIEELEPQGTGSVTVELEAGAYVLICNVVDQSGSHYSLGMRTAFEVTP